MVMLFYSLGLSLALVLAAPLWGWRMLRQGRYREGLRGRLGEVPPRLRAFTKGKPVVWVHCVSVGETVAAKRVARERFGVDRVFFFPLDFAFAVRPYLRRLKPQLLVLMESELWPRVLVECERAKVPVAVVNARVSDRSLPRYMRLRMLWKPLLEKVSLLLAQSEEDARRWKMIGAPAEVVRSAGNLKFDIRAAEETPLVRLVRQYLPVDARVLVSGSTHEGEEELLLDCWKTLPVPQRVMILAPRHPQRVEAVQALAEARGLRAFRMSAWRVAPTAIEDGDVLLVDTVGELASLYSLAKVAFVGGSLIPHGGQNPLEPARFGVPVLMGPHMENFREIVETGRQLGAFAPSEYAELCDRLYAHIDATGEDSAGQSALRVYRSQAGATARTVEALVDLLMERAR